ncbi:MAG TPA: ABC transporter permease subunit [Pyrinomonadaceae bacterium]|nr:ABC transporter permease subunit [Pyrinomonadaceae bacterium]
MRSPSFLRLLSKEFRELLASRAFWLLLLFVGFLVGHSFTTAVALYAEMSGTGGPAALPQGLTSLDGVLVPTWGAYDLAATLLFPFVAIRMVSAEKESGALKLLLQLPGTLGSKLAAKGLVLLFAWLVAWLPGIVAIFLWRSYGGHTYTPETLNLLLGHLLRGLLSGGLGVAAAAIAEGAASAAIITLAFTVGTWALDFVAAGRGGLVQQLASYTPTAALRSFEQGLLRFSVVVVIVILSCAAFVLAGIWLNIGQTIKIRLLTTLALLIVTFGAVVAGANLRASRDLSENHRNSFSTVDETALRSINQPLKITIFLSPEDPRLTDFEQNVLKKLRRSLDKLDVEYAASSRTGLFNSEEHYGEIWYELGGQKIVERSTIEEVVLDQIYTLSSVAVPDRSGDEGYPGYPLAAQPKHAAAIFYFFWPLLVIATWWLSRRF